MKEANDVKNIGLYVHGGTDPEKLAKVADAVVRVLDSVFKNHTTDTVALAALSGLTTALPAANISVIGSTFYVKKED